MLRVTWALAVGVLALPMAAWAASADQDVAQQIADSLRQSGRLKGYSIAVKYKDGTARLEGTVRAPQQAEQATELANRHPAVKRVINNLAVDANPAALPVDNRPAAPTQPQPQSQAQGIEARPASTQLQSNPASVLMSRPQPQAAPIPTRQELPMPVVMMPPQPGPTGVTPTPEQPFRQVSMPRQAENVAARPVPAPQMQQPAPTMAGMPAGLQPMPNARPIQSLLAQAPPQPMQGRMPMNARPVSQQPMQYHAQGGRPMPVSYRQPGMGMPPGYQGAGGPSPEYVNPGVGTAPAVYDQPHLPNYAWPSYAPYPNYAALTYPKQYSPTAWPYIGPFYPYPQVPLGWRKVTMEWDDGWWFLNFADDRRHCGH